MDPHLVKVFIAIASGAVSVQKQVERLNIDGHFGTTGKTNIQGEEVQKLDESGNQVFMDVFKNCGAIAMVGSEELKSPQIMGDDISPYLVNMDPVDGSSNIDVAISIGSIFGIWPRDFNSPLNEYSLVCKGKNQVAAAYIVYGSSTVMVIASASGVQSFTLDSSSSLFTLTNPDIVLPQKWKYYSVNYGNWNGFTKPIQNSLIELQSHCSLRYVGSLVADFHRNLLKGGVFLYPKDDASPKGKLRLMYEANPLSYVIKQAGGLGSSGTEAILDIEPESLHQRTPLILGNSDAVEFIASYEK
jgi:fructose-1,6-bisphosphatase I